MKTRMGPMLLAALTFAGCSATYTEPVLPVDHPASADAAASPPVERSRTLDLAGVDPVAPVGEVGGHAEHAAPPDHEARGKEASPATPESAAAYACPMHPEVTSDVPDQRCPQCGMKLTKQDGARP